VSIKRLLRKGIHLRLCRKEWLTHRRIDRSQLLVGVDVRGLPKPDCRKSRNGMLSIAMATIAEFESRYQVSNTHQEADIAGVENGGCLPPSSRSPARQSNRVDCACDVPRAKTCLMHTVDQPSRYGVAVLSSFPYLYAFVPQKYLPALDRGGRDAPMLSKCCCQESFVANDYFSRGVRTEQAVPLCGIRTQARNRTVSPTSPGQKLDSAVYRSLMARNVVLFGGGFEDMSWG